MKSLLCCAALVGLMLAMPWAMPRAMAREPGAAPAPKIAHGEALTAAMVGPAAAGLASRGTYAGGEIHDGHAYAFVREVPTSATYDGFEVTGPHLLIERARFTGPLDIYTRRPVVLRGVSIRPEKAAAWALHTRPEAGPVLMLWSETAAATIAGAPGDLSHILERGLYLRSDRVTVFRSHMFHSSDGMQVHGVGTRVIETLIDQLTYWAGDHNDGLQMLGRGADLLVVRSRIENPNTQTSCLNLIADRVRVEASYLSGGGWTVYGGKAAAAAQHRPLAAGVVVTGTVLGREHFPKGGHFGPVTDWDAAPGSGFVWRGNRWADGTPIEMR